MQRADRPRPRRGLHSRSQQPSVDWGPHATGRHGLPTIGAGGYCHLPYEDQLPTPPWGAKGPGRVERASLFIFIVQVFTTSRLVSLQCNTAMMAVWLNRTKLWPENRLHNVEPLDTGFTSPWKDSSHFLEAIRCHRVGGRAWPAIG